MPLRRPFVRARRSRRRAIGCRRPPRAAHRRGSAAGANHGVHRGRGVRRQRRGRLRARPVRRRRRGAAHPAGEPARRGRHGDPHDRGLDDGRVRHPRGVPRVGAVGRPRDARRRDNKHVLRVRPARVHLLYPGADPDPRRDNGGRVRLRAGRNRPAHHRHRGSSRAGSSSRRSTSTAQRSPTSTRPVRTRTTGGPATVSATPPDGRGRRSGESCRGSRSCTRPSSGSSRRTTWRR